MKQGEALLSSELRQKLKNRKKVTEEVIIVNEIPYQVNKSRLIERIADLVKG